MLAIRPVSILSKSGKKVITIKTGSLDTKANGEREIGDSGQVLGRSQGAILSDGSVDCVMTVIGNVETQRWAETLEAGVTTTLQFNNIDGRIETGEFFVVGRSVKWDNANGTINGSFQFEGGATRKV